MSMPSGCSDSSVFRTYMKEHFLKFVQGRGTGTIFLNAGHKSHIGLYRIDWAWKNNTVLFVLLLHCFHGLQPMGLCSSFTVRNGFPFPTFITEL